MEDEITKALVHWEREYLGRGPTEATNRLAHVTKLSCAEKCPVY